MFNKQPLHLQTHRLQRPSHRGVLPSVAQYLQKIKTPEKEIEKRKESPSYRIKSNSKLKQSNSLSRQTSSQSPSREKAKAKYNSFHSQQIKQRKRTQEVNVDQESIKRRQKTEAAVNENYNVSPTKNTLMESQEIMLKLQKNAPVRRVKTEECERDLQCSIRGTVQRQYKNQRFENNDKLLDLLLLSTIELKRHFEKAQTSRPVMQPKVKMARLSIKHFPQDFFQ